MIQAVGMKRRAAKAFLKRLRAIGWTCSPLFLNRITAMAHKMAVISAAASPMYGMSGIEPLKGCARTGGTPPLLSVKERVFSTREFPCNDESGYTGPNLSEVLLCR